MHRGFCLPAPRHARRATSIACNSGPASPAGETRRYGRNTPLAQRELRACEGNWSEGRIAKCPRLQQMRSRAMTLPLATLNRCPRSRHARPRRRRRDLRPLADAAGLSESAFALQAIRAVLAPGSQIPRVVPRPDAARPRTGSRSGCVPGTVSRLRAGPLGAA